MQPTDISSFNNGPVETNKQKKIYSRMYLRILKTKTNIYIYIYIYIKADPQGINSKYNFTIKSSTR